MLNGRPYFGRLKLDSFFHELICKEGGPHKLDELRFEVEVYCTDIYSLEAERIPRSKSIPEAPSKFRTIPVCLRRVQLRY